MNKRTRKNYFDTDLLLIIVVFMAISCFFIYSAEKYLPIKKAFALKQMIWYIGGFGMTAIIYFLDFDQIKKLSKYLFGLGILLLAALIVAPESIAPNIKGAKSWFSLPGFSLQPSEFMKVFLIIFLAKIIVDHHEKYQARTLKSDFYLIGKMGFATAIPLAFILLQPDAGTAMVVTAIFLGMVFVSGIDWKIISALVVSGITIIGSLVAIYIWKPNLLLSFLDDYQLDRVHSWLDPFQFGEGIGFQLRNSILAIGSGMNFGKGFNNGVVYVPEAHSDFIFTVIAEEGGFLAGSVVIALYFILIYKIVAVATFNKGQYEQYIAVGVISMLTFHIFENIGMVMGLVPITGIPLPLLSYGGSSIIGTLMALSLILNMSAKTKRYMFDTR